MDLYEIDRLARDLAPLDRISLTGGEPFLRRDLVPLVHILHRRTGIQTLGLTTNGFQTETIEQAVREILRRCPGLRVNVSVSLDGPEPLHDAIRRLRHGYRRAVDTLERLRALRGAGELRVGVNATLMPENKAVFSAFLRGLRDSFAWLDYLGADFAYRRHEGGMSKNRFAGRVVDDSEWRESVRVLAGPGRLVSRARDYLLYYLNRQAETDARQPIPCHAADFFVVVKENGQVSFCEEREPVGSLREARLPEILQSESARRVARSIRCGECACSHCVFQGLNLTSNMLRPRAWPFFLRAAASFARGELRRPV
jgi:MoaA/NifB/PqqE/SkfB family radical SAM enzyme